MSDHATGPNGETAYYAEGNWYVQLGYGGPRLKISTPRGISSKHCDWDITPQRPSSSGYVTCNDIVTVTQSNQ